MSLKTDVEKALAVISEEVHALENVPRDLHQRVQDALHRLTICVADLRHLEADAAPIVEDAVAVEQAVEKAVAPKSKPKA